MPALLQALKISEKAVNQGFEWEKEADVWAKLHSEISELQEAISHPDLISPKNGQQKDVDNPIDVSILGASTGGSHDRPSHLKP